jgi:hypothetical protein
VTPYATLEPLDPSSLEPLRATECRRVARAFRYARNEVDLLLTTGAPSRADVRRLIELLGALAREWEYEAAKLEHDDEAMR